MVEWQVKGGTVEIQAGPDGSNRVIVYRGAGASGRAVEEWVSRYPPDLLRPVCEIRGVQGLIDELRRDEDPLYVQACLEKDLFAYIPPEEFAGKRLLDFGCGAGASTMILSRLLPRTELVGIDLSEQSLRIARARGEHYRAVRVRFLCSPSADALPDGIGTFDYILLSAVYEHLLPDERRELLPRLWVLLRPGGVLFIDQTPWRWFPFEGHTTRLPLVNYLPDGAAHWAARHFSRRVAKDESWQGLLRRGIRGGTVGEIMAILRSTGDVCEPLRPSRLGIRDRVDLWRAGYAVSIQRKHPWAGPLQRGLFFAFKAVHTVTGAAVVPALSLAIRKPLA